MTISLILAESALEMIPREIFSHPAVKSHARKMDKHPSRMLLDNSWHYAAMKKLHNVAKRGRPDLVHLAIVTVTSAPIYKKHRKLKLYVHTVDDHVIHFGSCVRIPKSYHRFTGLIEALYRKNLITVDRTLSSTVVDTESMDNETAIDDDNKSDILLELRRNQTFVDLIKEKKFSKVIGLSSKGILPDSPFPYETVVRDITNDDVTDDDDDSDVAIVIGGFQKGHFSDAITLHLDTVYSVDSCSLEAHVVISRLLYECEKKPFM